MQKQTTKQTRKQLETATPTPTTKHQHSNAPNLPLTARERMRAKRHAIESGAKPYAIAPSATIEIDAKLIPIPQRTPSERRKGDAPGITLATPTPTPTPTPKSEALASAPTAIPQTPEILSPAPAPTPTPTSTPTPLPNAIHAEWFHAEHGCFKFRVETNHCNELAVAVALHCGVVAIRPHGAHPSHFGFVGGDKLSTQKALAIYSILRFAYWGSAQSPDDSNPGYYERFLHTDGESRKRAAQTLYLRGFAAGFASIEPQRASAELVAAAAQYGRVFPALEPIDSNMWRMGFADGARYDLAAGFAKYSASAKVSAAVLDTAHERAA